VTGSRAGLLLLALGMGLAIAIIAKAARGKRLAPGVRPSPLVIVAAAGILLAGAAMAIFRVGSVARLLSRDVGQDLRVSLFDTMASMAARYFPVGGGFGSFTDLFKIHEPLASLSYFYVNHAHNDLLELVIEGGLPAIILALAALAWAGAASLRIWRRTMSEQNREVHLLGLVASAMLLLLLIASLSDYPLRTPALAAIAALCAVLVSRADKALGEETKRGGAGLRETA
jgi:O-antigen ligase